MATFYTALILLVVLILASPLTATLDGVDETAPLDLNPFRTVTIRGEPTLVGYETLDDSSRKYDKKDKLHEGIRGITDRIVDHFTDGTEKRSNMKWLLKRTSDMLESMEFRPTRFFFIFLAVMLGGSPAARELGQTVVDFFVGIVDDFFSYLGGHGVRKTRYEPLLGDPQTGYPVYRQSRIQGSVNRVRSDCSKADCARLFLDLKGQ